MADIELDWPEQAIARLTLNRPEALNAFTFEMYARLIEHLARFRYDTSARVVILTGTGRGFCAGHDLKNAGKPTWYNPELGRVQSARLLLAELGRIPSLMHQIPQPIICAVNGVTAGIGFSLALASDLTIAARSAKFVNTFHNAATGHELGVSYLLPRIVGTQRAAEILYTSRPIPSDEAQRIGLILKAVDDESLMENAVEMARSIALNVPVGISLTKQSMWLNQGASSLEAAIEMESRAVVLAQSTEDASEKRASFFEKRPPHFHQK